MGYLLFVIHLLFTHASIYYFIEHCKLGIFWIRINKADIISSCNINLFGHLLIVIFISWLYTQCYSEYFCTYMNWPVLLKLLDVHFYLKYIIFAAGVRTCSNKKWEGATMIHVVMEYSWTHQNEFMFSLI